MSLRSKPLATEFPPKILPLLKRAAQRASRLRRFVNLPGNQRPQAHWALYH